MGDTPSVEDEESRGGRAAVGRGVERREFGARSNRALISPLAIFYTCGCWSGAGWIVTCNIEADLSAKNDISRICRDISGIYRENRPKTINTFQPAISLRLGVKNDISGIYRNISGIFKTLGLMYKCFHVLFSTKLFN